MRIVARLAGLALLLGAAACGRGGQPEGQGYGAAPAIPNRSEPFIPNLNPGPR